MPSRRTQQRFKLRSTSSSSRRWKSKPRSATPSRGSITWINMDIVAHTATARGDWDVMIPANESASLVLTKAGIVEYYCRYHFNMKGRIIITPKLRGGQPPCVARHARQSATSENRKDSPYPFTGSCSDEPSQLSPPASWHRRGRQSSGAKTHRPKLIANMTCKAGIDTNPPQSSGELSKL